MRRNNVIALLTVVFLLVSCKGFHDSEFVEVNELLPVDKDFVEIDAMADGEFSLDFYATSKVHAEVISDAGDWARMTSPATFDGDGTVTVDFETNPSFRRMVAVKLTLEDKGLTDTLYFKQKGIVPHISSPTPYAVADGSRSDKVGVVINTNVSRPDLHMEVVYLDDMQGWIEGLEFSGDVEWDKEDFIFVTKANDTQRSSRALVKVWFDDGWGEDISAELYITMTSGDGKLGTPVMIGELSAHDGNFSSTDYLEGVVISDCNSDNMAENPNTAHNVLDETVSRRTVYLQDGQRGVRLLLDNAEDNIFVPGMTLTISLDGVTLDKKEAPVCCTLRGISRNNLLKAGNADRISPVSKTIAELTPEDIYTYVTLTDVEFLNKRGAYTNMNEAESFFDGWASLLADVQGNTIFAPVNRACNWRRTGSGVPQGSGTVTGIIVSEDLCRLGNPGDWQIRVLDDSGFDMENPSRLTDFAAWTGASGANYRIDVQINAVGGSVPGAVLTTELTKDDISAATENQAVRRVADFSGKTRAGDGIVNGAALGYMVKLQGWYNFEDDVIASTKGLVMSFSTLEQTGSMIAYISFLAWGVNGFYRVAPAHWTLEYSVNGGEYQLVRPSVKSLSPQDYVHLRPGPSPEAYHNGRTYYPSTYMAPGFCDVAYILPQEVMDKENVKVRFAPSTDGVLFDLPAEAGNYDADIERNNRMTPAFRYNGDIHFAEISFKKIN